MKGRKRKLCDRAIARSLFSLSCWKHLFYINYCANFQKDSFLNDNFRTGDRADTQSSLNQYNLANKNSFISRVFQSVEDLFQIG
jgi:hypothetical protein